MIVTIDVVWHALQWHCVLATRGCNHTKRAAWRVADCSIACVCDGFSPPCLPPDLPTVLPISWPAWPHHQFLPSSLLPPPLLAPCLQPMQLLSLFPRAYLMPHFVPKAKCEHVIEMANRRLAPSGDF